jgi:Na+/H+ antiporter NhaC
MSVIPLGAAVALAMGLREIIPGLVGGLLVGGVLLSGSFLGGLEQVIKAVVAVLQDPVNLKLAGFLYLFGGLVGMIQVAGGVKGFVRLLRDRLKTPRSVVAATWATLLFTFVTPTFRIVTVGPILRDLRKRLHLPGLSAAYMLDVSSVPPVVLLPIGTAFAGYMTSVTAAALRASGLEADGFTIFLQSIPYNFFAWTMLITGLVVTLSGSTHAPGERDNAAQSPGTQFVDRYRKRGRVAASQARKELHRMGIEKELEQVEPRPLNLILVLLTLLLSTGGLLYLDGSRAGGQSTLDILLKADAVHVLLLAVSLTLIAAFSLYVLRGVSFDELVYHFFDGANQLSRAIVLLVLVWSLSDMSRKLGLNEFVVDNLSVVSAPWIPVTFLLVGSTLGYFIGSSWGTWGLLMPLAVSMVAAAQAPLVPTVGAVFASGTFGSFASPLGDTTVTTAALLKLKPTDHARHKLPTALLALGISALFYVLAGFTSLL